MYFWVDFKPSIEPVICSLYALIIDILYGESIARKKTKSSIHRTLIVQSSWTLQIQKLPIADCQSPNHILLNFCMKTWKHHSNWNGDAKIFRSFMPVYAFMYVYSFLRLVLFSLFLMLRRFILLPCIWKVDELKRKETKIKKNEKKKLLIDARI